MQDEHIWKFHLEYQRLSRGLRTKYLSKLVDEVLESTDDQHLCAHLADFYCLSEMEFLNALLNYLAKAFPFRLDTKKLEQTVECEKTQQLIHYCLPQLQNILEIVQEEMASNTDYSDITKIIYGEFEAVSEALEAEVDVLSTEEPLPWHIRELESVAYIMKDSKHQADEVVRGVHEWSPVWEEELVKWIRNLRKVANRLGSSSSLGTSET